VITFFVRLFPIISIWEMEEEKEKEKINQLPIQTQVYGA